MHLFMHVSQFPHFDVIRTDIRAHRQVFHHPKLCQVKKVRVSR